VQLDHLTTRDKYSRIATDLVVRRLNRPAVLVSRHKDSLTSWLRTLHHAWFDNKNAKRASKRAALRPRRFLDRERARTATTWTRSTAPRCCRVS
jgi:hypothetical protein